MNVLVIVWVLTSQSAPAEPTDDVELVWTCPVHRETTEAEPGQCDLCGRELVRALIRTAYSCPIHSVIAQDDPGQCPICGRELYPVSEELAYACPMHSDVRETAPGSCPRCNMALELETSSRPHQDHNPKHGGLFFMAPDNWHHLEGVYPEEGLFRVYLYNNFSQPLDASGFRGRAVLEETFDPATRQTHEIVAFPLAADPGGAYLEARVGSADFPREITAKIQFEPDGAFERFDFIFADLSRTGLGEAPSSTGVEAGAVDGLVIPDDAGAIAEAIGERNEAVRELVTSGAFAQIYLPALEAKDLALALESRVAEVPESSRGLLRWALKQLVRSAWLLDDYGDLGNREKVSQAYDWFDEASREIESVYAR